MSDRVVQTKFVAGKYKIPVKLIYQGKRIFVQFPFSRILISEIKQMEGHKWHGHDELPRKIWSIADSTRNAFQIAYLEGKNPYSRYEEDFALDRDSTKRPLYDHQLIMKATGLTYHYVIWACEMGTGKTLSAIEVIEAADLGGYAVWYVGPRSGVVAVEREIRKWRCTVPIELMTYERLTKRVAEWEGNAPAPRIVIFDESSKIKNPTAQRSQAAKHLADAVRTEHGDLGYVILMSGTPAPKNPVDWWWQCEVACPGFIKEGSQGKFRTRLSVIESRENMITGGVYPHIVTWLDDAKKCNTCGEYADHAKHDPARASKPNTEQPSLGPHAFEPSKNEVEYLYKRMAGLVLVQFKKDCLDLPDKQYVVERITPTAEILRAAKLIKQTANRAIEALTRIRELSDGFQYTSEQDGIDQCPNCLGTGQVKIPQLAEGAVPEEVKAENFTMVDACCDYCGGDGSVPKYIRTAIETGSPKDKFFIDQLDLHEDTGRYVVWGGFTGTIDRLIALAHQQGWCTLRVDGRAFAAQTPLGEMADVNEYFDAMDLSHPDNDRLLAQIPKLCFVGHPQAGGMALTLTSSPTALYYSNCFDGGARMQSEDRIHRAGMDVNRGATIIDLEMLPTDRLVLENLRKKKRLQDITMGQLEEVMTA